MSRVNTGKYRVYRNRFNEIQNSYNMYREQYRGDEFSLNLNLDIFMNISGLEVKNEINYIQHSANELERSLQEMLYGDKFESKEIELEYVNMKNMLSEISSELESDLSILSRAISSGYYYED